MTTIWRHILVTNQRRLSRDVSADVGAIFLFTKLANVLFENSYGVIKRAH